MKPSLFALALALPVLAWAAEAPSAAETEAGKTPAENYRQWCAGCHDQPPDAKTPPVDAIRRMSRTRIRHALVDGPMAQYVGFMDRRQVAALAAHLARDQASLMPETAFCPGAPSTTARLDRWGFDASNRRWQQRTALRASNVGRLRLAWTFAAPNVATMRSQPAASADTVFLPTEDGELFALDRRTGCIRWRYRAERPLRTAATLGAVGPRPAVFVGDQGAAVHAVDAASGKLIWQRDAGLFPASITTGAPIQHGDRLFVPISAFGVALAMQPEYECCKSHGAVRALDAGTGDVLWTTRMTAPAKPTYKNKLGVQMWGPSGAAVWTTPAIDAGRGLLYVGTGENTSSPATELSDAVVAIRMADGGIEWHFQGTANDAFNMACGGRGRSASCPRENGPDFDFGASVVIARNTAGKDVLLAGQKSGSVFALDPDDGALIWQRRIGPGSALGGVHWGLAADATQVYVPIADPAFPRNSKRRPGVWALRIDDGSDVWGHSAVRGCVPSARRGAPWPACSFRYEFSAAASVAGDVVLAGALDGRAFAFSREDGEVLWEFATKRPFEAANGLEGHGGAIDNAGPFAVDDQLFVLSGYDMFGQMPGNVLLAFELAPPAG